MSASRIPPDTAVAELTFSFQDQLTATIHNAFGVAVEIAVVEITKLVGQVLRDVRDQMDEALRDNKSLKFRLQEAENELCSVRSAQVEPQQSVTNGVSATAQVHQLLNSLNVSHSTTAEKLSPFEDQAISPTNRLEFETEVKDINESFCEIGEDGRVFTQDIKPDIESPSISDQKEDFGSEDDAVHRNDPEVADVGPRVQVKVEAADQGCNLTFSPSSDTEEEYCADRLSVAQSKLLEDWRPEPLLMLYNDPDSFVPSTSHSLSDSPNFSSDMPDLDILSSPAAGVPPSSTVPPAAGVSVAFAKPFPPRSSTGSSPPGPHEVTNRAPRHTCKVCGEKFFLPEELSRHRSLVHPKDPNKNPKHSLFPPGRSPYHCSLCGRDFNRMEHLKIHQRIHTGERPYGCSVCNARFRHSWALTRHFRIHTGEKPYACSQCGKTFRNCGGLRFHQRSHSMTGIV
ncbi:uncharacterized protein si:ch211-284e13.5 [Osmerus mordax]|uniref:uncharacterized protein si:ch211-284e13.5 n=1 Tax=Osmerus mordax TaxID=8014 RepID=UPI003510B78F